MMPASGMCSHVHANHRGTTQLQGAASSLHRVAWVTPQYHAESNCCGMACSVLGTKSEGREELADTRCEVTVTVTVTGTQRPNWVLNSLNLNNFASTIAAGRLCWCLGVILFR